MNSLEEKILKTIEEAGVSGITAGQIALKLRKKREHVSHYLRKKREHVSHYLWILKKTGKIININRNLWILKKYFATKGIQ